MRFSKAVDHRRKASSRGQTGVGVEVAERTVDVSDEDVAESDARKRAQRYLDTGSDAFVVDEGAVSGIEVHHDEPTVDA